LLVVILKSVFSWSWKLFRLRFFLMICHVFLLFMSEEFTAIDSSSLKDSTEVGWKVLVLG
jgi:hypothetical protein